MGGQSPSFCQEALEDGGVHLLWLHLKEIAGRPGEEQGAFSARRAVGLQSRPQVGDVDPEGILLVGTFLAPQLVEDPIRRDDLIAIDQEQGQQRSLLVATQIDALAGAPILERPEHIELDTTAGQRHLQPELRHLMSSDLRRA